MIFPAWTRFTLLASLILTIGCADDGKSDDDVGSDTDDSTGTSEGTGSETESGSTDDADTSSTDASTGDSTDATDSTGSTDSTESTDTADTDSTDTTDTTDTTTDTADTNDTGEEIMCPDVFPQFDKSCNADSDCAVVIHTTDCCGNSVAWGVNAGEVDAFEAAEAICDSQYPQCECPSWPTVAEDGNDAWEPAEFAAECVMGSCMSYVPG